jgi:hypothetical protein
MDCSVVHEGLISMCIADYQIQGMIIILKVMREPTLWPLFFMYTDIQLSVINISVFIGYGKKFCMQRMNDITFVD